MCSRQGKSKDMGPRGQASKLDAEGLEDQGHA